MSSEDTVRLLEMEKELHKRVISQDEAIKAVCQGGPPQPRPGLQGPEAADRQPSCSPARPGVGKTLLAKTLAEFMFGDEERPHPDRHERVPWRSTTSAGSIGAPPGYVGYEEGGQLTEKIRRRPYAVVLLDEIEKAHPDVYNMLLQIMEEGRLTDTFGRKVDFKNMILIMTTNVGARSIASSPFGFSDRRQDEVQEHDKMKTNVMAEISRVFKPEFIGRLDEIVVFHKLTDENMKQVVDIELSKVRNRLKERGLTLRLSDEAKQLVIDKTHADGERDNVDYGARPLRRSIEMYIEDPLSEELLRGVFQGKNLITVKVREVGNEKQFDFEGAVDDSLGVDAARKWRRRVRRRTRRSQDRIRVELDK